jgi:hypothetical protein
MKLTLFCVSTASGLLHDVFQYVSAHPIPIEFCYGMLSNAKDTNTFSVCVCVQGVSPSRQCNYALPSPPTLLFSFCAQRASGMHPFTNSFVVCICPDRPTTSTCDSRARGPLLALLQLCKCAL